MNSIHSDKLFTLAKEILKIDSNQIIRQHNVHFIDYIYKNDFIQLISELIKILNPKLQFSTTNDQNTHSNQSNLTLEYFFII